MTITTIGEAFETNPRVKLPKGTEAPRVEMADIEPFTKYVRASHRPAYSGGAKFNHRDVLMARITPSLENGKTSVYIADKGSEELPASGSTEFIVLRARPGISDPDYCYYLMTSPGIRDFAISTMTGSSGRQRVQTDSLSTYEIDLPSLEEQRRIAKVLSLLDDKIESNQRSAKSLKQYAKALIMSEEKKSVPASEVVEPILGGTPRRSEVTFWEDGNVLWASAKDVTAAQGGFIVDTQESITEAGVQGSAAKIAPAGTVVITARGTVGAVAQAAVPMAFNQTCYGLKSKGISNFLILLLIEEAFEQLQSRSHGSVFATINKQTFNDIFLEVPLEIEIDRKLGEIESLILFYSNQNVLLTNLRDTLLPELLSGSIAPNEIASIIKSVEVAR